MRRLAFIPFFCRKSLLCSQVTNLSFRDIRLKRSAASFGPVKRQRCVYEKFNTCPATETSCFVYGKQQTLSGCQGKVDAIREWRETSEKKKLAQARNWPSFVFLTLWRAPSAGLFFIFLKTRKRVKTPNSSTRIRESVGTGERPGTTFETRRQCRAQSLHNFAGAFVHCLSLNKSPVDINNTSLSLHSIFQHIVKYAQPAAAIYHNQIRSGRGARDVRQP